jgi:hypothetical protein
MSKVNSDIASFFRDPSASSVISFKANQIAAPLLNGAALSAEELETGGGLRIVYYFIDGSPSMRPVADDLLEGFNVDLVPAIKAGREDDIAALRIGGLVFSSDLSPIWGHGSGKSKEYFHTLDNLPPLTKQEFDPSRGDSTALHKTIVEGTAYPVAYAAKVQAEEGTAPEIEIVIFSDGANNCYPTDPAEARKVIIGRDKSRIRFSYLFFDTGDKPRIEKNGRLVAVDPETYAYEELGIDKENIQSFMAMPNETPEDRKKRFRRMMRVASRISASKGTSAVQAAAAISPDDIV